MQCILAIDQGTTSSRSILYDASGRKMASAQQEFKQFYPRPGWVEHDPEEIWRSQHATIREVVAKAGIEFETIAAIGITNQRETTTVWDKTTGEPIYPAIVWQDRRTAEFCKTLQADGLSDHVRRTTGLLIDPYFSGTKLHWILNNVPGALERAERGELLFGTIDSWLLYKLTGGAVHKTDLSNASRTMLFDIRACKWDPGICERLDIPLSMLPEVASNIGVFGETDPAILGTAIPVAGMAGDQHAALFGQACYNAGEAKNTYGTGCFMLLNTGAVAMETESGLLTTIAWGKGSNVSYALEGSVFIAGAAIQWLRDELQIISEASETAALARSIDGNANVYLVPAFAGLGTPYWDPAARGTIVGLTRGTGRAHLVRAALESIAYQTRDILDAMQGASGINLTRLLVDGGAAANDFLMQFQADILNVPIIRPVDIESTARGAANMAALAIGLWNEEALKQHQQIDCVFEPGMPDDERNTLYSKWQLAVERSRAWAD